MRKQRGAQWARVPRHQRGILPAAGMRINLPDHAEGTRRGGGRVWHAGSRALTAPTATAARPRRAPLCVQCRPGPSAWRCCLGGPCGWDLVATALPSGLTAGPWGGRGSRQNKPRPEALSKRFGIGGVGSLTGSPWIAKGTGGCTRPAPAPAPAPGLLPGTSARSLGTSVSHSRERL